MPRFANVSFLAFAFVVWLVTLILFLQGHAQARPATHSNAAEAPGICTYAPLEFSITGYVPVEDMRPFTPSPGESYLQFAPTPPLTTTASSTGNVLLYSTLSGTVSGGISGTFALNNLNGIAITGSTDGSLARGFLVNNLVITDTIGSMNLLFATNFRSAEATAPFYPRFLDGYVHSVSTTGGYAQYRFAGTLTGLMEPPTGGPVRMFITIDGKLFTGFNDPGNNGIFSGSRSLPVTHTVTLQPGDILARFYSNDMPAGSSDGYFDPISVFTGTTSGSFTGTFSLDSHSLLVGNSFTFSPGWLAGNFRATSSPNDTLYGPWLTDLPGVAMHGYFFQSGGTGIYANSLIFEQHQGAIAYQGGEDIAGGFSNGYFCTDMIPVGGTFTPTPSSVATSTSTSTRTVTHTPIPTATVPVEPSITPTNSATLQPTSTQGTTQTPAPTSTVPIEPTNSPVAPSATPTHQATSIAPTSTPTPTPTSTLTPTTVTVDTPTPTTTSTVCALHFEDMPPGSTFYSSVMCLACLGIVNGYPCGSLEPCGPSNDPYFRPSSSITRGQVAKIVSEAAGFNEPVSGQSFEDVSLGSTFYEYAERLKARGIMSGYPCGAVAEPCMEPDHRPYFRTQANATRGQLSKIVASAAGLNDPVSSQTFEDVPQNSTFYEVIERLAGVGAISGYPCDSPEPCIAPANLPYFRPGNPVTRGQTTKIVANAILPDCPVLKR